MPRCPIPLVAAAVLLVLPSAAATPSPTAPDAQAALEAPPRLEPAGEPAETTLTVTYDCAKRRPDEPVEIRIDVVARPDWLTARPEAETVLDDPDATACATNETRRTVQVEIALAAAAHAPARRPADLTVQATVELADGDHRARATTPVEAAFYGTLAVDVPSRRRAAAGDDATYPIAVENRGNGPVTVQIQAIDADDGLDLQLPAGGVAPAPWAGEATWTGEIVASGAEPGAVYRAEIDVRTAYAPDPAVDGGAARRSLVLQTPAPVAPQADDGAVTTVLPGFSAGFAATIGVGLTLLPRDP